MKKRFTLHYKDQVIQVERNHQYFYTLKYPDFKFIELEHNENGWVVEDRSGDFWTEADITALGVLIEQTEPEIEEIEGDQENTGLPGIA